MIIETKTLNLVEMHALNKRCLFLFHDQFSLVGEDSFRLSFCLLLKFFNL